jgi:hypothetical protein
MKDVFISYSSANAAQCVRPLAHALDSLGITYWLDEVEIAWGDSISEKINAGLQQSKYVVVIVSPEFLDRQWPKKELSSALHRETETGRTLVLPIIVGDPNLVLAKHPFLAEKRYLLFNEGVDVIAKQIYERVTADNRSVARGTQSLIESYCAAVTSRNLAAAYEHFSIQFQATTDLSKYGAVFSKSQALRVGEFDLLNHRHEAAYAHVRVLAKNLDGIVESWEGTCEFRLEENRWRIHSMKGLRPSFA